VDDRLNGDGAGIPLGVNDPILGAHMLATFGTIWALYWLAQKNDSKIIAGGKSDDSGLSL
jgi:photosystem II PsbW protein